MFQYCFKSQKCFGLTRKTCYPNEVLPILEVTESVYDKEDSGHILIISVSKRSWLDICS